MPISVESDIKEYNLITQMQLIEKLTETYINNDESKNKWLEKTTEFDKDYLFFRQGYKDMFLEAKAYFNNKQFSNYQEYKETLSAFIESRHSNITEIEGFFGFASYKSALLRTSKYGEKERGGKVFQNNHYDNKKGENNGEFAIENSGGSLTKESLPRYSFSKGHILTNIRPLSTFQNKHSYAIKIPEEKYIEVASKVLEEVLITDDDLRGGCAFVNEDNKFRFYALIGRSCVTFVKNKLKILFGGKLNWWDNTTWTPQGVYDVIKKHSKHFSQQETSILRSLLNLDYFYQNYTALCSMDSAWECEDGLKAFSKYCNAILHSALLDDTKANRLGKHKIAFLPMNTEIADKIDDIYSCFNTHFCIDDYFKDAFAYGLKESKVSLLILNEKQRFLKADVDNNFIYSDFDFANRNEATLQGFNLAIYHQQYIIFTIYQITIFVVSKMARVCIYDFLQSVLVVSKKLLEIIEAFYQQRK